MKLDFQTQVQNNKQLIANTFDELMNSEPNEQELQEGIVHQCLEIETFYSSAEDLTDVSENIRIYNIALSDIISTVQKFNDGLYPNITFVHPKFFEHVTSMFNNLQHMPLTNNEDKKFIYSISAEYMLARYVSSTEISLGCTVTLLARYQDDFAILESYTLDFTPTWSLKSIVK